MAVTDGTMGRDLLYASRSSFSVMPAFCHSLRSGPSGWLGNATKPLAKNLEF